MLSGPGWKPDAIVRLLLGVFVCIYAGSLVTSALEFHAGPTRPAWRFYTLFGLALGCLGAALSLLRRPWNLDDFMRRMTPMLAAFYLGLACGSLAQRMTGTVLPSVPQMLIAAISFQGAALALAVFFLREHQVTWVSAFGLDQRWKSAIVTGLLAAFLFLPLAWLLQKGSALLLDRLTFLPFGSEEQQSVQTLRDTTGFTRRAGMALITIVLAPIAEEFLFRGVLYAGLKQIGFPRLALWATSLLFAAVHMNAMTFIPLMAFSLVLVALYERTGNLLAAISAHALFNAINFTLLMISS